MTLTTQSPRPHFGLRLPARHALLLAGMLATAGAASAAGPQIGTTEGGAPLSTVGDATRDLLALQRGGSVASTTPRPIDGEIASRSHQRYLKSFEHPIPEKYGTAVHGSSPAATPAK